MRHVDESRWIATKERFSFAALFSGAISLLLATILTISLFFSGRSDVMGNALKLFAVIELLFVIAIFIFAFLKSALRSFGSKRLTFRNSFADLFHSIEQVWFYIPLSLALVVYLMFGGI